MDNEIFAGFRCAECKKICLDYTDRLEHYGKTGHLKYKKEYFEVS